MSAKAQPLENSLTPLIEKIEHCEVRVFKVPTDSHESDGTMVWDSTTLVLVQLRAGKITSLGYSYASPTAGRLIQEFLFPLVKGQDAMAIPFVVNKMTSAVRNFGRHGIAMSAVAAVEIALWDLKAKILDLSLVNLLGGARTRIPIYGSGGFTSYSDKHLRRQLEKWVDEGVTMVKMKIGREPGKDLGRIKSARRAIGDKTKLFVDANGAFTPKQSLNLAERIAPQEIAWFEEPVTSDNLAGLKFIRERAPRFPGPMEIAAGEYNYDVWQAQKMLDAGAVDVLQADATRCSVSGFLQMASLCEAFQLPLSAHTAPALHAHLCCAANRAIHVEYFHDHSRIEQMFFDGPTTRHHKGFLTPDPSRPGLGLEFKSRAAAKFEVNL